MIYRSEITFLEYTTDGQYVPDTAPVDHISKSDDSDIEDSKPSFGELIVTGSFVCFVA